MLIRYAAEDVGKKRCADYERIMIGALLRTDLARIRLSGITSRPFARYRDARLRSVGPAVVRRELVILQHMFETAIRERGYAFLKNPILQVKKPKEPPSRNRQIDPHEEQLLFDGCNGSMVTYLKSIIIVALETGMRRGEILNVKYDDINEPLRTLRIPITKNGHKGHPTIETGSDDSPRGLQGPFRAAIPCLTERFPAGVGKAEKTSRD